MGLHLTPRRLAVPALWAGCLLHLVSVAAALAADTSQPAFPGAFRATSERSFEDVERWSGIFDAPDRDEWQKPDDVVAALGLREGATVADLGAGTGYFSERLSRAVGPNGTVLSIETQPEMIVHIRSRAERENTANVVPILASAGNARIPRATVDVILMVDTLHHIDGRLEYLGALKQALRAGGTVAIIDWKKEQLPVGPPMDHKIDRDQVVYEFTRAGYRLAREMSSLPYQYFLIFEPGKGSVPP